MEIAIGKNQVLWIKKQTVKGTAVWPAATDAVLLTGDASFKQDRVFNADKQKRNTLSELGRFAGVYKGGEFSFPTYIKPAGALGVVPVPAPILESWFGKQTIVGNTSVTYTPATITDEFVYLTILVKDNFETYLISDAVVSKGMIKALAGEGDDSILSIDASGVFLGSLLAGTDLTTGIEAINSTEIGVVDASKFEVGQKIIVGTSGLTAGHLITVVTIATNTITIAATGLESEQAAGVTVKGWTPSITEAGSLVHGRFGSYQEKIGAGDYATVLITEGAFELDNGLKVLNNEKTNVSYPDSIVRDTRKVTFNLNRYVKKDLSAKYQANNRIAKAIKLPWGSTAAYRMRLEMPNVEFDSPQVSGDAERSVALAGHPFATSALDNEASLIFD